MRGRKGHLALVTGDATPARCPGPPPHLSDQARTEWRRVAGDLHRRRLLGRDMLATLESYCLAVGMVRACQERLTNEGDFIETEQGLKAHPATRLMLAAMREARLLAAELALTPHRRGKKGPEDQDDDDLSDLGL